MNGSPYPRIALTLSCGLLTAMGFVIAGAHAKGSLLFAVLSFSCVALGLVGMYVSGYFLREEVRNERWPEVTLARMRRLTGHSLWRSLMALALVTMCVSMFFSHRRQQTLFWTAFCFLQTLAQIGNAFTRHSEKPGKSKLLDWSRVLPLRSEHWGER